MLYAEISAFPEHAATRKWWEKTLSGTEEVGLASPAVFGFLRIATNPRVFTPPMALDVALDRIDGWLVLPNVRFLVPGPRHLEIAFALLRSLGTAANLTTDVQLATFAIENTATLCSNDSDFSRFGNLTWWNPLAPKR